MIMLLKKFGINTTLAIELAKNATEIIDKIDKSKMISSFTFLLFYQLVIYDALFFQTSTDQI